MSTSENKNRIKTAGKQVDREQLSELVSAIEKQHGKGSIMFMNKDPKPDVAVLRSGSLALDEALGIGGYPRGRIIEIFGPESSGKTTLTLHAIAQVQAEGGMAAFIDAEHALDVRYARAIGVDTTRLLVSQPDCGEQGLEIADALTRSQAIDLIVIDSVAALVPKAEIEGEMGDPHMGLHARLMSQALRKLAGITGRTNTTLMLINQLRQKIGVVFGSPETTTGGQALKFFSSCRLDVRRIGKVEDSERVVGNRTRVKVIKNKCAPPFGEAEFDIRWGIGIDAVAELLDCALLKGVIEKKGSYYVHAGTNIGQGRERAREQLLLDGKFRQKLADALQPKGSAERVSSKAA